MSRNLKCLLEEAEQDLEAMRELRYEPEYYQDYRKMEELDAKIDDKHNEIAALMQGVGRKNGYVGIGVSIRHPYFFKKVVAFKYMLW